MLTSLSVLQLFCRDMSEGEAVWDCAEAGSRSVLVQGELPQVYPGLLALSSVCGSVTGAVTGALLLYFCVRPILLSRQGYNIRRLLEPEDADLENRPRDGVSSVKNEGPEASNKDNPEERPAAVSGDVAAFATRAKVVYPINQKYRPLADGASNPSLHEASRVPPLSEEPPSPSTSSCSDEDSDDDDEECEGQDGAGPFDSSVLPQSLQNHSFSPVCNRALTLTLNGAESRMNLYFLALRDVQQNYVQLQEEKDLVYSLIVKTLFGARFPKSKQESDFCQRIIQTQEKELNELKKRFPVSVSAPEESEGGVVTLEEIERSQKELLEHGLQTCKGFSDLVEDLSELLLRNNSVFHPEEAQQLISSISNDLLQLENHLNICQDSLLTRVHEKVLWWQELSALLQTQPALLRQEAGLRQGLVATAMEQLTSDGVLSFGQMEKTLSEIQEAQSEGLKQHGLECVKKTTDLVTEKMNRLESKRRKVLKSQNKEKRALEQPQTDLQGALKHHEQLTRSHRKQLKDLETQQEQRLTEALTELWTSLRSIWSLRIADQSRSLLLSSVSSESALPQDQDQSRSGLSPAQVERLPQDQTRSGLSPAQVERLPQNQAKSGLSPAQVERLPQDQTRSGLSPAQVERLPQNQAKSGLSPAQVERLPQDQTRSGLSPAQVERLPQNQAKSGLSPAQVERLPQNQTRSGLSPAQVERLPQNQTKSGLSPAQAEKLPQNQTKSGLSPAQAERLWSDLEQALGPQLCEAECSVRDQLQETTDRLNREGQTWSEEVALLELCLKHLHDHQTNILQTLELRLSYSLHNQTGRLLALKHHHLLGALRRLFMVRHISLNLLKEMRLSTLSALSESDCRSATSSDKSQNTGEGSDGNVMQRKWTEECGLLELSLKQEFLSELETGAELLQRHLQTIIGNALSHSIHLEMDRENTESNSDCQDDNMKCRLTEAASESVYLTKDSLSALVQKYYSQLQRITEQLQQEQELSDDEESEQSSAQIMKSLLRELQNWSRKPRSAEFQQRVEQHKRRLLAQTDREQQRLWEKLRHRKITRDITLDKVKDQLMGAEERFIEQLAALARVSLPKEEPEPTEQEQNICDVNIRELLALNPALDPALNPSLTPLISAPVKIVLRDQKKTT